MEFCKAKKVVIVTEAAIQNSILETVTKLGVSGYTIQACWGKGERGVRSEGGIYGGLQTVRIEIITTEEIAKKIAVEVTEKLLKNYAGIAHIADVEVISVEKFCLHM